MPSDHQNWREKAKCKDLTGEESNSLFFVGRGGKSSRAKSYCSDCPVQRQCLNFAIYYGEGGTWGGMSELDRSFLSPMIGILSTAAVEASGVDTSETRDYRQWGLGEVQIQQERKKRQKFAQPEPYPAQPELTFQPLNQQQQVLVVEL